MIDRIEKKVNSLTISSQRQKNDKYSEIVFFNKDYKKWDRAISGILGPAVNTRWEKPDKSMIAKTRKFGGIRNGQTLYLKEYDDCSIMAMMWPWKDKKHTTLKISMMQSR